MKKHRELLAKILSGEVTRINVSDPVAMQLREGELIQVRTSSLDDAGTVLCRASPTVTSAEQAAIFDAPPPPALLSAIRGHN